MSLSMTKFPLKGLKFSSTKNLGHNIPFFIRFKCCKAMPRTKRKLIITPSSQIYVNHISIAHRVLE